MTGSEDTQAAPADEWAPARIWLQRGVGEGGSHTWCGDSQSPECEEAEYIRATPPLQAGDGLTDEQIRTQIDEWYFHAADNIKSKLFDFTRVAIDRALLAAGPAPKLAVWYGPMPESNGKSNFTAILHKGCVFDGITIDRSEYPDRVRYEADRMRWMIGEIADEPDIMAYDAEKHSGYVHPSPTGENGNRQALYQAIHTALMEHGLNYTEDTGSGEKFPLVDKLCAPGDDTIQTGRDEIAILAEAILDVIPGAGESDKRDAERWRSVKPFLRVYTDDFEEREYMPPNIGTVLSVSEDEDLMPGRHETPDAWADEAIDAAMKHSGEQKL